MTEICAGCGKPILINEPSYYRRDPTVDIGKTYHSACGDPLGIQALVDAAVAAERERCAKIAENYSNAKPGDICKVQAGDWQYGVAAAIRALPLCP